MKPALSLKIIFVEDPNQGGYTAFFTQFPEVIAEGESEIEAENNLINALQVVLNYEAKSIPHLPSSRITERDVNFAIA